MLHLAPLYESLAHLLVSMFSHTPCGSVLDVAKALLVLFAHNEELVQVSTRLFRGLSEATLKACDCTAAPESRLEHPDVLSEFFAFLAQVTTNTVINTT